MSYIPFVCLGIGFVLGVFNKRKSFLLFSDKLSILSLSVLMLSIGIGIGLDKTILNNMGRIGFNCFVVAVLAIFFSVIFTYLCEKTLLPLDKIDKKIAEQNVKEVSLMEKESESSTSFVWTMPACIITGLVLGVLLRSVIEAYMVDLLITICLVILYICVGISQGSNNEVFQFIKKLGWKIIFLSIAILVGSVLGGYVASFVLGVPSYITTISASGMSYYSVTGAFLSKTYGVEAGTYGFIVNVMREFVTVVSLPVLRKISMGSPIAAGGAGNMDTMLAPVTKFVGARLGLVTLVTGTILTFIVPFLLPILSIIIG
jgi:uncharacterized membrane protein YbjE (DUF340 family)